MFTVAAKFGVGVSSAILLTLSVAGPAFAASSSGTQHIDRSGCSPDGFCYAIHEQEHLVSTPSGNVIEGGKGTLTESSGLVETVKGHSVTKDGVLQQSTSYDQITFTDINPPCVFTFHTIYANGQVRHDTVKATGCGF